MDRRETAARELEAVARELQTGAEHCVVGARHFRNHEVSRAGAHQWAAFGHITRAITALERRVDEFASRTRPVVDEES